MLEVTDNEDSLEKMMRTLKYQTFIYDWKLYILLESTRGTREQIANIHWIIKKGREFQKNIYFCFLHYAKGFDCVDHNKLWKILKRWEYQTTWPAFWETYMQVRKQQLELDMEQRTGSK